MPFLKSSRLDASFIARPITHRGLHGNPEGTLAAPLIENTVSAFAAACKLGAPIELDLQSSSDDRAVVFHDKTLRRIVGRGEKLRSFSLEEIRKITLRGTNDKIQSLGELFEQIRGRVPLLIEIKDQHGALGDDRPGFLDDIASLGPEYKGALAFMSFNPYYIGYLRHKMPSSCLGLVTDNFHRLEWRRIPHDHSRLLNARKAVPGLEIDFISHNALSLSRVKHIKLPVLCWTVCSPAEEEKARRIADNVTFEGYIPEAFRLMTSGIAQNSNAPHAQ